MKPIEGVLLALQQLRVQKMKSFFATLGVLVGVTFLITVVTVIEGVNRYMQEDFGRRVFGLNTLTVRRTPSIIFEPPSAALRREWQRRPILTFADAEAIRSQLRTPALIAVESDGGGNVAADDGTEVTGVELVAASAEIFAIRDLRLSAGRTYGPAEDRAGAPVIILGDETADALFGARDPIGKSVRIGGHTFHVIGVLERQGSLFGFSLDNQAIAPAGSALARIVAPRGGVERIVVRTESPQAMDAARTELEAILRVRHRLRPSDPNSFEIETAEDSMAFWTRINRILFIAFPGLVAIALIVGGMVIMNIMLVSVAERTREIGVRKALGATRRDVWLQVLVESAALSGTGAAIGIGIGVLGGYLVSAFTPLPAAVAPLWLLLAAGMGIAVGVIAGLYPADRAARMDPIVALRQE